MNLDPNSLNELSEYDIQKYRKPRFQTFSNNTVKFMSTLFIELEESTYDKLYDIGQYPFELDFSIDMNFSQT